MLNTIIRPWMYNQLNQFNLQLIQFCNLPQHAWNSIRSIPHFLLEPTLRWSLHWVQKHQKPLCSPPSAKFGSNLVAIKWKPPQVGIDNLRRVGVFGLGWFVGIVATNGDYGGGIIWSPAARWIRHFFGSDRLVASHASSFFLLLNYFYYIYMENKLSLPFCPYRNS